MLRIWRFLSTTNGHRMYIHKRVSKGHVYYALRECYWEDGKPRMRTILNLGIYPDIEPAFLGTEKIYFDSRKGRELSPLTQPDRKRWDYLQVLLPWYKANSNSPKISTRFKAEENRLARTKTRPIPQECQTILGLPPDATADQIKAAYHRKARKFHPDHGGSDEAMAAVNEAYDRLMSQ